jgi:hypothetical protein
MLNRSLDVEILALEPMALMLCIWTSILLGILYMYVSSVLTTVFASSDHIVDRQVLLGVQHSLWLIWIVRPLSTSLRHGEEAMFE